jgi:hypothetical protein
MMRMSQEGEWKTKKVSEKNRSYTASATAKRFSSTSEYTDQYITDPKNHSSARFTFLINNLSINFRQHVVAK